MSRLRCAITTRSSVCGEHGEVRCSISREWIRYLAGHGVAAVPVPIWVDEPVEYLLGSQADFLLLSNGESLGELPARDQLERKLLEVAFEKKIPVFAVCRGFQMVCSYFGGKVSQFPPGDSDREHAGTTHSVNIVDEDLEEILGSSIAVNSYHHDFIRRSDCVEVPRIFALTDNGTVEGFVDKSRRLLAIQWHPERVSPDQQASDRLVRWFLKEMLL